MLKTFLIVVMGIGVVTLAALLYGSWRWNDVTRQLRARLDAARVQVRPQLVDFRELDGLPIPVQRYFHAVLVDGQPMLAGAHLRHRGTFNMRDSAEQWKPFTSDQKVVAQRPGFHWDGRITVLPGVTVRVHDAYVAGEGILKASLLGLIPIADLRDTGELAQGELLRFFAEAVWYPTSLLPVRGVRWEPVDERSAYGTLSDGDIAVTLLFTFDEQGLISTVHAAARGRTVDGSTVPTPWQGRFSNYTERDGMRVPLDGVVEWLLPDGPQPYWRGRITQLVYERPAERPRQARVTPQE